MSAKSLRPLEQLQNQARLVTCRLRSGQTLRQASAGLPAIALPEALIKTWALALHQIESGHGQALGALESFSRLIDLELRMRRQIQSRTLLPRLQAYLLAALCGIIGASALWWFPPTLKPSAIELATALALLAASFFAIRLLLKRFEKNLWLAEWAIYLELVHQQLTLGLTWATAAHNLTESPSLQKLPLALRLEIDGLSQALKRGENPAAKTTVNSTAAPTSELQIQIEQLRRLGQMVSQGLPVAEIVGFLSSNARESFQQNIDQESQRLSLALLVPLFLGQAPALLVLLFGPLLRLIS